MIRLCKLAVFKMTFSAEQMPLATLSIHFISNQNGLPCRLNSQGGAWCQRELSLHSRESFAPNYDTRDSPSGRGDKIDRFRRCQRKSVIHVRILYRTLETEPKDQSMLSIIQHMEFVNQRSLKENWIVPSWNSGQIPLLESA
jgi:hypothetical protein